MLSFSMLQTSREPYSNKNNTCPSFNIFFLINVINSKDYDVTLRATSNFIYILHKYLIYVTKQYLSISAHNLLLIFSQMQWHVDKHSR